MPLSKNNDTNNFYPVEIKGTAWKCDYLFSTHRGCWHDCLYCSSKKYNIRFGGDPKLAKRLKSEWRNENLKRKSLPPGHIFVNPYCDIFALPEDDIRKILFFVSEVQMLNMESEFTNFIFQTKNPQGFFDYCDIMPKEYWAGTTLETNLNIDYSVNGISRAPSVYFRFLDFERLISISDRNLIKFFITIEPIMQFDSGLANVIKRLMPDVVFIGANTSKAKLNEPSDTSLMNLIYSLYDIIGVEKVYLKKNIRRLVPHFYDKINKKGVGNSPPA